MSRQVTTAVQTGDPESVVINHDLQDFTCIVTGQILFDPVVTDCGQHIERSASAKLEKCPCCNQSNIKFNNADAFFKKTLQTTIQQYHLHENVYFDLEGFKQIIAKSQLNTPQSARFLTLLQNAGSHLNTKEVIRTEIQTTHPAYLEIPQVTVTETQGKSPIEILAETLEGRDLLRKKLRIEAASGKYFFGNAEILPASLQIQINGKSIREWLSMTTAMEKFEKDALERMKAIENEERTITAEKEQSLNQFRLFLSRGTQGASSAASYDRVSAELQPLLKAAFGADLDGVKRIIEVTRTEDRSALLSTPASANYSETEIHIDTAFKAALATADEEMAVEIAQHLDPTEIARQFKNVFGPDYAAFLKQQEKEAESLFEGLEAAFIGATRTAVQNALNQVPNTSSVLQLKIAEFKTKLEDYVNKTRPLHNDFILAKAYEIYDKNWSPWTGDQLSLFSQPVIGVIQASALKTSTKRSMDIAGGIYHRAINIDKGLPARRSLFLAGSTTDVRSVDDLGSCSCIDIFGRARTAARRNGEASNCLALQKSCRANTSALENLCSDRSHTSLARAQVAR